ncbi:bifunctional diguanylate cyclase/phosphodiesterase [Deefgea rivuli]|uniref:bifunctional diguanylate cyclase/phosphodiesterase n=1 Tax=Deefgea rivuli TaxID=400948 RepID=UPI000684565C|nr:EAL domain-containing protein [Deefgea rivuli]
MRAIYMALQNKNHCLLALAYTLAVVLDQCFISGGAWFGAFNSQLGVAVVGLLLLGLRATPYLLPGALLLALWQTQTLPPWLAILLALIHVAQALCVFSLLPYFAPNRQIRIRDSNRLLLAGPVAGNVLFASILVFLQQYFLPQADVSAAWLMVWLAQSLSLLIIVPGVYAILGDPGGVKANWLIELTLVVSIAAAGGMLLLRGRDALTLEAAYLMFPLLIWSSLRLGQMGNSIVALIIFMLAGTQYATGQSSVTYINSVLILLGIALQTAIFLTASHRENRLAVNASKMAGKIFDYASEGILLTDADARIIATNPAFSKITGFSTQEAIGKTSRIFGTHRGHYSTLQATQLAALHSSGHWEGEVQDKRQNGELYPAWLSMSAVRDEHGYISNYVGVFSDYTARKESEQRMRHLAQHDALTGLLNRSGLHDALNAVLVRASTKCRSFALLFIDLDRFKTINDTLGHDVGDELLKIVAHRLQSHLKQHDTVARLGGDEFTVLLENIIHNEQIIQVAERILQALGEVYLVSGHELFVTGSIGISLYPHDGGQAAQLMKNADIAMYRAKELGKNTYQFYSVDMNVAHHVSHLSLENALRYALERKQLQLVYQPQFNLVSGELAGMECLIRWHHPELGLISPAEFIPIAEENGLIVAMGEWVLNEACHTAQQWRLAGLDVPRIAVNLSVRQFKPVLLVNQIKQALTASGLPAHLLELEVTESLIMKRVNEAVEILRELKLLGVQLAIDDFGTGYSSLSQLKILPLDTLKIDRSFIEGIPSNQDDVVIAETIIILARKIGMSVIAEGIETQEQMQALQAMGCDVGQGYFYSRPIPALEMQALLKPILTGKNILIEV